MPKGGWRAGAGRPTRAQAEEKAKQLAATIAGGLTISPRAYLQGLLNSPGSTKSERLKAAELLLKLPPEPAPSGSISSAPPMVILGIPRGVFFTEEQAANPDALIPYGVPIEPFTATSSTDLVQRKREAIERRYSEPVREEVAPESVSFESAEQTPPANVTPLRPFERSYREGARNDASRSPSARDPFKFWPPGD
jgi:hypothetical protein